MVMGEAEVVHRVWELLTLLAEVSRVKGAL